MANNISLQMDEILKEISEEVDDAIEEGLKKAPKLCKKELRANSPKNTGDYSKGWKIKRHKKRFKGATVYNDKKPRLTHLLENGHVIRNGKGTYGRAPAQPHIEPASEKATELFIDTVMEKVEKI